MAETILSVPDISCDHCARTINQALTATDGVQTVTVDVPAKRVRVAYDPARTGTDRMATVLEDEGYPVAATEPAHA